MTRRPIGRPPVPDEERRQRLTIRLPPALRAAVELDAAARNETITEYVEAALRDRLTRQ